MLSYKVDANVGGKLAQIGSRPIDGTARKMADDFFARFAAIVGAPNEPAPIPVPEAPPAPATSAEPPPAIEPAQPSAVGSAARTSPAALSRSLWIAVAILVLVAGYLALR